MGKLTISMAMFNSYVKLPEGINYGCIMKAKGKGIPSKKHGSDL